MDWTEISVSHKAPIYQASFERSYFYFNVVTSQEGNACLRATNTGRDPWRNFV